MKAVCAAALVLSLGVGPALADFYVVQDTSTKRCSIVEQRPTTSTTVVVGDGAVYTSRNEADLAMKKVKVCESGLSGSSSTTTTTTTRP